MLQMPQGVAQRQLLPLLFHKYNDFRPSKTVMTDEATFIDTDSLLLHFRKAVEEKRALLIPRLLSKVDETLALFNLPAMYIGLDALKLSQCALKHVRAQNYLKTGKRDLASIKLHLRLVNDSSLRRYGKETRLLSDVANCPVATLAFGRMPMSRLPNIFLGRSQLTLPG